MATVSILAYRYIVSLSKENWTVLIGNAYDHYDSALYGLMAHFLGIKKEQLAF